MDTSRNKFQCIDCNNEHLFALFAIINTPDQLGNRCYYCQTGTKPITRCTRKEPYDYERRCIRCTTIRHVDEFVWKSKDGKRSKVVKTCNKCRATDKQLRIKLNDKSKKDKPIEQPGLVTRKLDENDELK